MRLGSLCNNHEKSFSNYSVNAEPKTFKIANIPHLQLQGRQNTTIEVSLLLFNPRYFPLNTILVIYPYKSFKFQTEPIAWAPCGRVCAGLSSLSVKSDNFSCLRLSRLTSVRIRKPSVKTNPSISSGSVVFSKAMHT